VNALRQEMKAAGSWVFSMGLHPPATATVVRLKDREVLTTDGSYVEGKEHGGGFTVIRAPHLDSALEWGRKLARATCCTARPQRRGEKSFLQRRGRALDEE